MNEYAIIFLTFNAVVLLIIQRQWAPLPLLIGACYVISSQALEIGSLHFPAVRILITVGFIRILLKGERLYGRMNGLDLLMLAWGFWAVSCSLFYSDLAATLVNRLGLAYEACGIYFLLRIFCRSPEDVVRLCYIVAIVLAPVAVEMIYEKITRNLFFYEIVDSYVDLYIRHGHVRAQGPFGHSILAGTIGAVCLPLVILLWSQHRKIARVGIAACLTMVVTSASSGPILSMMAALAALYMYRYRSLTRLVRWLIVVGYIALDIVMKDPAYFIMARIDLAGGSTGWHRAMLIESAINHLSEWWLYGTNYTRHWMPTGVPWSLNHTDITNHYIRMGVYGGLPLMLLFIAILAKGFSFVGKTLHEVPNLSTRSQFMLWSLGASLFAHAVTFISVSYFDQSFVFLYLTLAAIGSARTGFIKLERASQPVLI